MPESRKQKEVATPKTVLFEGDCLKKKILKRDSVRKRQPATMMMMPTIFEIKPLFLFREVIFP